MQTTRRDREARLVASLVFAFLASSLSSRPANAQATTDAGNDLPRIVLNPPSTQIAQTLPPALLPTDITRFTIGGRNSFSPTHKFRILRVLPERFWFNSVAEVSQRIDTNVLFTYNHPKADTAFRVLPNVTLGYNVLKNTSIYGNYFVIKDIFGRNYSDINAPTTQSLAFGLLHVKPLSERANAQFTLQARELWLTKSLRYFDLLPGVTLNRMITRRDVVFTSALLQARGTKFFVPAAREVDPFFTVGWVGRRGMWTFAATDTLVTNFRHHAASSSPTSVLPQSNSSMIADFEINRPVSPRLPSLVAFVRAEPVFNWGSRRTPGISGFDFRLYGGLRFAASKPSYYGAIKDLRKQIAQAARVDNAAASSDSANSKPSPSTPEAGKGPRDIAETSANLVSTAAGGL